MVLALVVSMHALHQHAENGDAQLMSMLRHYSTQFKPCDFETIFDLNLEFCHDGFSTKQKDHLQRVLRLVGEYLVQSNGQGIENLIIFFEVRKRFDKLRSILTKQPDETICKENEKFFVTFLELEKNQLTNWYHSQPFDHASTLRIETKCKIIESFLIHTKLKSMKLLAKWQQMTAMIDKYQRKNENVGDVFLWLGLDNKTFHALCHTGWENWEKKVAIMNKICDKCNILRAFLLTHKTWDVKPLLYWKGIHHHFNRLVFQKEWSDVASFFFMSEESLQKWNHYDPSCFEFTNHIEQRCIHFERQQCELLPWFQTRKRIVNLLQQSAIEFEQLLDLFCVPVETFNTWWNFGLLMKNGFCTDQPHSYVLDGTVLSYGIQFDIAIFTPFFRKRVHYIESQLPAIDSVFWKHFHAQRALHCTETECAHYLFHPQIATKFIPVNNPLWQDNDQDHVQAVDSVWTEFVPQELCKAYHQRKSDELHEMMVEIIDDC